MKNNFIHEFFTLAVTNRNPSPTANVVVSVLCSAYEESLVECPIRVTTRQSAALDIALAGRECTTGTSLTMDCPLQGSRAMSSFISFTTWALHCVLPPEPVCKAGEILVSSTNVVQVCYHGAWRFVCGDFWTDTQAVVVCRQLNMPSLGKQVYVAHYNYGSTNLAAYIFLYWKLFCIHVKLYIQCMDRGNCHL